MPVLAGSIVKYQFSTSGGDIQFSSTFRPAAPAVDSAAAAATTTSDNIGSSTSGTDAGIEIVHAPARVPSDVEGFTGSYKASRSGALLLTFDNSFSWFTPKLLSYHVALHQPAFTVRYVGVG